MARQEDMPVLFEEEDLPRIDSFTEEHRFLSNFWYIPGGIRYRGLAANTVEHIYQALKTEDPAAQQHIVQLETPGQAKRAGQKVLMRPDWDDLKLGYMADLQALKYRNAELAPLLVATGDLQLVEGNTWHDTFWGQCSCERHRGSGENWLGSILTLERSRLAAL